MQATAAAEKPVLMPAPAVKDRKQASNGPKQGARGKRASEEVTRYYLANTTTAGGHPDLGEAFDSENEALVAAFRSPSSSYYAVTAFRAEIDLTAASPTIVKKPVGKQE